MNTPINLSFGLAAAGIGILEMFSAPAADGRNLQMVVVAESAEARTPPVQPSPEHPAFYVAFDGGYVEAGDPIANEQPPAASTMAQALQATLSGQGYEPATAPKTPSVVLVYHWGFLNIDSHAIRIGDQIDPNLHARLSLVSPDRKAQELEEALTTSRMLGRGNARAHMPGTINFHQRDILQLAHDPRYFVIVSAYDYKAIGQHQPMLIWRTKISADDAGISIAEALPTLLQGAAPYLGLNLGDFKYVTAPVVSVGRGEPQTRQFAPPSGNPGSLDGQYVRSLMKQEHEEFSGIRPSDTKDYDPIVSAPSAGAPPPARPVIQPKQAGA